MICLCSKSLKFFRICDYFCEISKFRDFMNTFRNYEKSTFGHISAKQFILTESPDHVLYNDI